MIEEQHLITSSQFFALIVSSVLAGNFILLPRYFLTLGLDYIWPLILSALYPVLLIFFISLMNRWFAGQSFVQYGQKLIGVLGMRIFSLFYLVWGIFEMSNILFFFSQSLGSFVLKNISIFVILFMVLLLCSFLASYGFKIIGRVNELLFYLLLPVPFFMLAILPDIEFKYLVPIFQASWGDIWQKGAVMLLLYSGLDSVLIYSGFVQQQKSVLKAGFYSVVSLFIMYGLVFVFTLGFFGPGAIKFYTWPILSMFNAVRIPFFERLEALFTFIWVILVYRAVGIRIFCISYLVEQSFGLKKRIWVIGAIFGSILAVYLFLAFNDFLLYNFISLGWQAALLLFNLSLIFLFWLLALSRRGKGEKVG